MSADRGLWAVCRLPHAVHSQAGPVPASPYDCLHLSKVVAEGGQPHTVKREALGLDGHVGGKGAGLRGECARHAQRAAG